MIGWCLSAIFSNSCTQGLVMMARHLLLKYLSLSQLVCLPQAVPPWGRDVLHTRVFLRRPVNVIAAIVGPGLHLRDAMKLASC